MTRQTLHWKSDWEETRQRFIKWWHQEGLLVYIWDLPPADQPHESVAHPGDAPDIGYFYTQPEWRARWNHYTLFRQQFPADTLPIAGTNIGPGSLALFVGSEAKLAEDTVWFEPCIDPDDPEGHPPLRFNEESRWWRITEELLRTSVQLAQGKYLVGCPDLIENIDLVAALRNPQRLLMDIFDRRDWVLEKVWEVNEVYFEAYGRIYDMIKLEDGSSCFDAFRLWEPGKTAKVQCDTSAMSSTRMFRRFEVPALTAQCEWLDYAMFHLDGHHCIRHLDSILAIEAIDAVEWTPSA